MPDVILQSWKLVLLAFIYLFLFRVLRAIWANLRTTTTPPALPVENSTPERAPQTKSESKHGISRLKVLEPREQAGREYPLDQEITIGRAPGCAVNIEDTYVSQLHARVFRRDAQVFLEDLGSTNGTFANGKKVSGPMTLRKGDKIQVGRTVLEALR
jgi:pSer/pThr/pTyr-binding forkhead associated (FHA) protein